MSSRREARELESRRHRSRFDQEPSLKRSRRDGKPETERPSAKSNTDHKDSSDVDQKHRRRLQDAAPLEAPAVQVSNGVARSKDSEKSNIDGQGTKHSDPIATPRSRYSQHEDRGNAGQVGRGFSRKGASDRGSWRDPKEHQNDRGNNTSTGDLPKKGERNSGHGVGNDTWRHDRFSEMERDPRSFPRKRSFREIKDSDESKKVKKVWEEDPLKQNSKEHPMSESDRQNERGNLSLRYANHYNRAFGRDREADKGEEWRGPLLSRESYGNRGGNSRGRERFSSRGSFRLPPTGGRVEKWKHDLYDQANKSPSPKNEEDVVAEVEALLAS